MTHENPILLQRMIQILSFGDEECGFFIHLDLKTPIGEFSAITGQNISFIDRIPVYWGEFSQVEAILSLLSRALESPNMYDYCVLITGSCYPLRTGGYIRRSMEANRGLEYMEIVHVPGRGCPLSRFENIRYPRSNFFLRLLFRLLAKLGLARRDHKKHLPGLEPYQGEGAWALSREACQYMLDFVRVNPHVVNYFRRSFAPDEVFFHTIIGNSKFHTQMRRNMVYTVWPGPTNGHPATIGPEDVAFFETHDQVSRSDCHGPGEFFFARKLNDRSLPVLRRIDAMIEQKEGVKLPPSREVDGKRPNLLERKMVRSVARG